MTPFVFILATLAAYRVSYLIVRDEGPFGVFAGIRGRVDPDQKTWIGRGLNCILCVSFWITLLITLILGGAWYEWLAMAGAIVLWREVITK